MCAEEAVCNTAQFHPLLNKTLILKTMNSTQLSGIDDKYYYDVIVMYWDEIDPEKECQRNICTSEPFLDFALEIFNNYQPSDNESVKIIKYQVIRSK
jgi:hypothetical protein